MNTPKVSVILPVYKTEKYLHQCIESIINQTLTDIEVIVIDEGDYDECRKIIDQYEAQDPRVRTIHQANGGYGASVNLGIDLACGEYIGIVESDDFIKLEMFEKMYNYAKELDAEIVKAPFFEFFDSVANKKSVLRVNEDCKYLSDHIPENCTFSIYDSPILMGGHASIWSAIYKREYCVENSIRFNEVKGGSYVDAVFRVKSLIEAERIAWLNQPFYCWRRTNIESTTNNYDLTAMLQRWNEVHALFADRVELYDAVGPYSIDNEYGCTLALFYQISFSEYQYQILIQNMSHNKKEIIQLSPILTSRKKRELLALIEDPSEFKKRIRRKQFIQRRLRPILDYICPNGSNIRGWVKRLYHRF